MSTELIPTYSQLPVSLGVADETIADLRERYTGLPCETASEYEIVRLAIADLRTVRVNVEKSRKDLKADALDFGKRVDAEAKRVTNALLEIEEPLKAAKQLIDDEKDRIRREKEDQERQRIEAELEARRLKAEEDRARIEAERKAEQDRIADEQQAERLALEAERAQLRQERMEIEAQQKAAQEAQAAIERAEREKLAEERRVIEAARKQLEDDRKAEQQRIERVEFERLATIRAEEAAKQRLEDERLEAERKQAEAIAERQRLEALQPDAERILVFVARLRGMECPELATKQGELVAAFAQVQITKAANAIEKKLKALIEDPTTTEEIS